MKTIYLQFDCIANCNKVVNAFKQVFQYKFAQAICKCVIEEEYIERAKTILSKQKGFVSFVEK